MWAGEKSEKVKGSFPPPPPPHSNMNFNKTHITPLFSFYLDTGLQCTINHHFIQYKSRKTFHSFDVSVADARRAGDESSLWGVVAETMNLLVKFSCGYRSTDRRKLAMTMFLGDENP